MVCRPSAVVSSNSWFSLNLISVVLNVLSDFMEMIPSFTQITNLGFNKLPICRVAKFTPEHRKIKPGSVDLLALVKVALDSRTGLMYNFRHHYPTSD